jgi:predicted MFS family arabinose efflux permease
VLAYGLFAIEASGAPIVVTAMMLVRMLPLLVLGSVAGALADRIDRRRGLLRLLLAMAAIDAVLLGLALTGRFGLATGFLGALAGGLFWALEVPIRRTMLAEAAGIERVGQSIGLEMLTNNATRMLGPAIGGAVVAALGMTGVLLVGVVAHLLAALAVAGAAWSGAPARRHATPLLTGLREGLAHARRSPLIQGTLAVTVIVNLWGFPYVSLGPVIAQDVLRLGPTGTGLLMACEGLGALLGSLVLIQLRRDRLFRLIYLVGTALYLAGVLAFALLPWITAAALALLLAGFGMAAFNTMQTVIPLAASPPELRGRALGLLAVAMGTAPFGFLLIGLLATGFGAPAATATVALIGLVALAGSALRWPELRRRAALRAEPAEPRPRQVD